MRDHPRLLHPLPPGYSGPAPKPERPGVPQKAPPGEPEVLEDIPFDLSSAQEESDRPMIRHQTSNLRPMPGPAPSAAADDDDSDEDASPGSPDGGPSKIRTFEQKLGAVKHEDTWQRTPNVTGTGAIHVKSFHCKLTGDSLDFLDQQINEWLDAHPQYEVKYVTTSIGLWTGKLKEPNLIVNVWV